MEKGVAKDLAAIFLLVSFLLLFILKEMSTRILKGGRDKSEG
jgi:hypothetical protein